MSDDRLLTIPQAADLLGKSETYVRDRIKNKTFAAMEVGYGKKRRKFKVAESKMLDHKKILDAKEKDRASRRRRPKVEKAEACAPAVQGDMFVGIGIKEALEKLLTEQKITNVMLAVMKEDLAAILNEVNDIESNTDAIKRG